MAFELTPSIASTCDASTCRQHLFPRVHTSCYMAGAMAPLQVQIIKTKGNFDVTLVMKFTRKVQDIYAVHLAPYYKADVYTATWQLGKQYHVVTLPHTASCGSSDDAMAWSGGSGQTMHAPTSHRRTHSYPRERARSYLSKRAKTRSPGNKHPTIGGSNVVWNADFFVLTGLLPFD